MGCAKSTMVPTTTEIAKPFHPAPNATGEPSSGFDTQYTLGKKLGEGTFSIVREGIHKETGHKYAVKCIKKQGLTQEDLDALHEEVKILKQVQLIYCDWDSTADSYELSHVDGAPKYHDTIWFLFRRSILLSCYRVHGRWWIVWSHCWKG